MKIYKYLLILIIFTFLQACKTSKNSNSLSEEERTKIFIYQNNEEQVVPDQEATFNLKKEKFSIRYFNKKYQAKNEAFYAARVAAFTDKSELASIQTGMKAEELSFFAPGSGMAPSEAGDYDYIIFNNYGHHYLIYEKRSGKRVKVLENFGDFKKLEFEIKGFYEEGNPVEIANTSMEEFYLAIYIDYNLNKIIDEDELHLITIQLK